MPNTAFPIMIGKTLMHNWAFVGMPHMRTGNSPPMAAAPPGDPMSATPARALPSILAAIGHTPLVRLTSLESPGGARIFAKCEFMNPGGSTKDRVAASIVADAEARGVLRPGATLVEATSGNTGIGLALVGAVKGYRVRIVIPEKMSHEKRRILRALGADVVVTPNAAPDHPDHYLNVARRLVAETPDAFHVDQFGNGANARAHETGTGPEITEALGRVHAFVAGAGTGGTLTGVARHLKKVDPATRIVCVDPEGSVISGDEPRPYKVEGIGDDFVPDGLDTALIDTYIRISDAESFTWARRLAREAGLFVGGSSGSAVLGAVRIAETLPPTANVVCLLADTGRNYLSTFHDDGWLAENGFAGTEAPAADDGAGEVRGPVARGSAGAVADARAAPTPAGPARRPLREVRA